MGNWGKWALVKVSTGANRQLRQMDTLGPMNIGVNGHWGKWAPGKMSTRANGFWAIGANEHFEQMDVWVKW